MSGLSCSMWDLVPLPGIELRPPALGVCNLKHWTTSEVLNIEYFLTLCDFFFLMGDM